MGDRQSCSDENCSGSADESDSWERFADWLFCFCVITFDLEIGQALEKIYPSHVTLTEQEKSNICYLAFPDSNSGCMGDTQFHVRLRTGCELTKNQMQYNSECPATLKADESHFWGFIYFRQVKDPSLPRGYFQKSIVLLTRLPFTNLYYNVCALLAPKYFEDSEASLEAGCHDINRWPSLQPGQNVILPILGTIFQTFIPKQSSGKLSSKQMEVIDLDHVKHLPHNILASIQDMDMFEALSSVVAHLHLLWELVLTAEPIVIMAGSPTECSAMVQALISIINPLPYSAEFRPYFTIHDSEFKEFTRKQHNPPCVILGVTNPFFAKTLQHWPHTIRLTDSHSVKSKLRKVGNFKMLDSVPGVYSQYKPFLIKDKTILKKLHIGIKTDRPTQVQTAMLRRHFLELTESFMIPLERYMATLMPLQKNISPFKSPPAPNPFNPENFLSTLTQSGPHLTTGIKGDWTGLYKTFFRSPNFSAWFNQKYNELTNILEARRLDVLAQSDLKIWADGKEEVEVVDMVLKLRQLLKTNVPMQEGMKKLLEKKIEDVKNVLPEDVKHILNGGT